MTKLLLPSLIVLGLDLVSADDARTATITWLGRGLAHDVSADGSVIVGSDDYDAFRWTAQSGMVELGSLPGGDDLSQAYAVSADGRIVVGRSEVGENDFGTLWEAFRWTDETGMIGLGHLPGELLLGSEAAAMSADGNVIVGTEYTTLGREAFRWTAETGMVELGKGSANAISADGSVVAGSTAQLKAYRWTAETDMLELGNLPGADSYSIVEAMSADGTVIVGGADRGMGLEPFRWTAETGMIAVGNLGSPGECVGMPGFNGSATDVSADGSIVIGHSCTVLGSEAFIWDAKNGMRNLKQVLTIDYGLDLSGWTTSSTAMGISPDGTVIVGDALTGGAWMVEIPELLSLRRGDFDRSGILDVADINLLSLEARSHTNNMSFDLNDDDVVDQQDRRLWVHELKSTWFGDANLDGEFNSSDLITALVAGTYKLDVDAAWGTGDFDGNGRFDSGDLILALADGGYEAGPRPTAVPEPSSFFVFGLVIGSLTMCRKHVAWRF